ncbi:MAG: hypothetical protein JW747_09720 [Candidatus Aminicenantes bacterium]|nr:hypothetical protein [Candidatus Aminicenantes bacterium]
MDDEKHVFEVRCPHCRAALWIDAVSRSVVGSEKGAGREKSSLDDLLSKEKQRREGFERKFEATAELEKSKHEKAREKFEQALSSGKTNEEEEQEEKA